MTQRAYQLSKEVYEGKVDKNTALDRLEAESNMNRGSAQDYINGFCIMMEGGTYKRTFNSEATDYFLTQILNDFGKPVLEKALQAVYNHIQYYETLGKGSLKGILKIYSKHLKIHANFTTSLYPDEVEDNKSLTEGVKKQVTVNAYERNIEARNKCLEIYGYECSVCFMSFKEKYGELGKNFIHVHHIKPLADIGEKYVVDPENDLRPVCPNCHSMLHRKNPPLSVNELKTIITNT